MAVDTVLRTVEMLNMINNACTMASPGFPRLPTLVQHLYCEEEEAVCIRCQWPERAPVDRLVELFITPHTRSRLHLQLSSSTMLLCSPDQLVSSHQQDPRFKRRVNKPCCGRFEWKSSMNSNMAYCHVKRHVSLAAEICHRQPRLVTKADATVLLVTA